MAGDASPAATGSPAAPGATATPSDAPFIKITSPAPGAAIRSPLRIEGEARVFEGALVVAVTTSAGVEPCAAPVVADRGAPDTGRWSVNIGLRPPPQPGDLVIQAYALGARDGALELMDSVQIQITTGDPAILVTSPRCGDTVGTTVTIDGTASVFEGTVTLTARDQAGNELASTFTTASQGAPSRGPFSATLELPPDTRGPIIIEAWSASAEDGSPEHVFGVPVIVGP